MLGQLETRGNRSLEIPVPGLGLSTVAQGDAGDEIRQEMAAQGIIEPGADTAESRALVSRMIDAEADIGEPV